jgi:hypothetical protein
MHFSFILIRDPIPVDPVAACAAYRRLFPGSSLASDDGPADVAHFRIDDRDDLTVFAARIDSPIPTAEADESARFSLGMIGERYEIDPHRCHFLVTTLPAEGDSVDSLTRHTRAVAAIAEAHGAAGIYDGNAGATHPTPFYVDVARNSELPVMLWTGISLAAAEDPDRFEVLTLGMGQFELPNLLLTGPGADANELVGFAFDLLAYLIRRGEPIPEGETVGRSEDERFEVRYVPSPLDENEQVARIDIP